MRGDRVGGLDVIGPNVAGLVVVIRGGLLRVGAGVSDAGLGASVGAGVVAGL